MRLLASFLGLAIVWMGSGATAWGQDSTVVDASHPKTLGIADQRPSSGPCVELPNGKFMVPYTAKIPGTDVEFEMLPIPGGKFVLGSPEDEEDRRDDEGPQVELVIEPFWMGKHEVTWGEYQQFMKLDRVFKEFNDQNIRPVQTDNSIDAVTAPSSLYDPSFTFSQGEAPNQPCATVTQFAAKQYTKFLSLLSAETFYRLPTEAEWEYACRAGTTTRFYFGDDVDELEEHAWYIDNSDDERHAVGEKLPNPWGLHDMYGNVAEWTLDAYGETGYGHVPAGSSGNVILTKNEKLFPRVLRGGSFELEAEDCRSAARIASSDDEWKGSDPNYPKSPWWYTDSPSLGTGFRIVRPYQPPADRLACEAFWGPDLPEIKRVYENRINDNGRGAIGIIDPNLPAAIRKINK